MLEMKTEWLITKIIFTGYLKYLLKKIYGHPSQIYTLKLVSQNDMKEIRISTWGLLI